MARSTLLLLRSFESGQERVVAELARCDRPAEELDLASDHNRVRRRHGHFITSRGQVGLEVGLLALDVGEGADDEVRVAEGALVGAPATAEAYERDEEGDDEGACTGGGGCDDGGVWRLRDV